MPMATMSMVARAVRKPEHTLGTLCLLIVRADAGAKHGNCAKHNFRASHLRRMKTVCFAHSFAFHMR